MTNVFVIAEIGVNHNGDINIAKKLINIAAKAGANAVKFQTFNTDKLVTKNAIKAPYQKKNAVIKETQYQMLKKLQLSPNDHFKLAKYCKLKKIEFLSTAFDKESFDFLSKEMKLNKFKIASSEINNAPLLLEFARKKKQLILSTGMSYISEIEKALGVIAFGLLGKKMPSKKGFSKAYKSNNGKKLLKKYVTLLHCTSAYPTKTKEINLNCINSLKKKFQLRTGFSDHSSGIMASIIAVSMGATLIEKHITLDKNLPGPDHLASLNPVEFKQMISEIRNIKIMMGSSKKIPTANETRNKNVARKSIFASKKIKKDELFSEKNIAIKRPGNGKSPFEYWTIIGKRSKKKYEIDEKI